MNIINSRKQQQHIHNASPVLLPFELEKMIFEVTVREQHSMGVVCLNILLVCNRVRAWYVV